MLTLIKITEQTVGYVLGVRLNSLDETFVLSYGNFKVRASVWQVEKDGQLAAYSVDSLSIAFISPNISHGAENTFYRSV